MIAGPRKSDAAPPPAGGGRTRRAVRLIAAAILGLAMVAGPAAAQWTRVAAVPATDVFALRANADTIVAGLDSVTYVSADGGATWARSAPIAPGVTSLGAVWIRNRRIYAGTFGQGVFVSDDLGASWQPYNQGLVGGPFDSQLYISDFEVRGDSLFASTLGAGVYVRGLGGAEVWQPFGAAFEPNQAANVNDLARGGTRLLACAGANGTTFRRDPGDGDWTIGYLVNGGIRPGLTALTAWWTGLGWVVGTSSGVFTSPNGEEPWTRSTSNLGSPSWCAFAQLGNTLFGVFDMLNNVAFEVSVDGGATWTFQDGVTASFAYQLAMHGGDLYAARSDGLWVRTVGTASVVSSPGRRGLHFALAGPQPVRDEARFTFELQQPAAVALELFDVSGRRAADRIEGFWSAGPHVLSVSGRGLPPGVYAARLTAGRSRETVRVVRVP